MNLTVTLNTRATDNKPAVPLQCLCITLFSMKHICHLEQPMYLWASNKVATPLNLDCTLVDDLLGLCITTRNSQVSTSAPSFNAGSCKHKRGKQMKLQWFSSEIASTDFFSTAAFSIYQIEISNHTHVQCSCRLRLLAT